MSEQPNYRAHQQVLAALGSLGETDRDEIQADTGLDGRAIDGALRALRNRDLVHPTMNLLTTTGATVDYLARYDDGYVSKLLEAGLK